MTKLECMLQSAGSVALFGHVNPDGDCLGSSLGCWNYIQNRYPDKLVRVYLQKPGERFAYMQGFEQICHEPDETEYDLAIVLDCADMERLGEFAPVARRARKLLVIDHHVTNDKEYEHAVLVPTASSTSELVMDQMERAYIDKAVAECIYTGLIHDTGVFRFPSTSAHTMELAGFCMSQGIDFNRLIDEGFYMKTHVQQQVMGKALMESRLELDGRCVFAALSYAQMRAYGVNSRDVDGIVAQLRLTRDTQLAVFAYETNPQQFKFSLRSNSDELNVAAIAAGFGGGGHVRAAGCTLNGSLEDVTARMLAQLKLQLDGAGASEREGK